ncbi:MAG: hypothetical protein ACJAUC_004748, partial [Planctomycetota bacterium]
MPPTRFWVELAIRVGFHWVRAHSQVVLAIGATPFGGTGQPALIGRAYRLLSRFEIGTRLVNEETGRQAERLHRPQHCAELRGHSVAPWDEQEVAPDLVTLALVVEEPPEDLRGCRKFKLRSGSPAPKQPTLLAINQQV